MMMTPALGSDYHKLFGFTWRRARCTIIQMASSMGPEARAHYFTPQCWLAGFRKSGEKDGRLWVTDLRRRKQWVSNPQKSGHRRDFYRISDAQTDPVAFEKAFGKIETASWALQST
jgi:hypothetical protein